MRARVLSYFVGVIVVVSCLTCMGMGKSFVIFGRSDCRCG